MNKHKEDDKRKERTQNLEQKRKQIYLERTDYRVRYTAFGSDWIGF
jgi:hypothetical protein